MPADFPLPANVKEVLSRLPVKDQGEFHYLFYGVRDTWELQNAPNYHKSRLGGAGLTIQIQPKPSIAPFGLFCMLLHFIYSGALSVH